MSQDDFNSAFGDLLAQPFAPPPDPRQIALKIVRKDDRRTRILAGLCLLFWLLGTAGILLLVYGLNRLVIYIRIADMVPNEHERTGRLPIIPEAELQKLWGTDLIHHSIPYIAGSVVSLLLAALFTVLLILHSRKATLNRININLRQISEQLRQMNEAGQKGSKQ